MQINSIFSSAKMTCPFRPLIVSLILTSVCGNSGLVGQPEKGGEGSQSADPQWGQVTSRNLSMPLLPADFHKENTVTNDWLAEGEEDEDYLDLDKLFSEDDDYIDIIDMVPQIESEANAGNILQLFPGKSRIQRLNILNAKFAFNLYRALKEEARASDNIFIAPVGISTAMAMISLGLQGETHEQVHSVLQFKDFVNASSKYEITTIHNLFRKLTHRLFRRNFGYTLRSVNDLYVQKQFPIRDDFKTKVKEYYFAEAQAADFSDPVFISKTNNHILKLTKGLIKDALENIDPATEMMILNCIYFKGSWVNKFPMEMTHNHNFRLNEREVVKVSMMQTKGNFLAANDQELDCDVLQLEYVGGISMLIVVPHKLSGMKTLETQLTPQVVERWQKSMTNRTREVLLPKFKLEKNYNLVEALKSMGVTELLDKNSNMTGISDQRITIDLFKHQSTITVNEEGTQAAAVTAVGFMPLSTQVRFSVDRPFLFLVYEHRTSCLLFMGRVANPTKS
ncbi:heparin cofactor 2 isoform X1 [Rhinolophus ferrumequinum]|uniref:Serpin family D member 1 n=2 Tax=Rhinolophus ferrumequinum TaxID=59479 RepID=A0A671FVN7_RHIFE|nr:heparin cofactor 2 isoform X1 [Rhinolophus ferrumequinum]